MIAFLLGCAPAPLQELRDDFERSQEQRFVDCGSAALSECPEETPPEAVQCLLENIAAGEAVTVLLQTSEREAAGYWLAQGGVDFPFVQLFRTADRAWRNDCTQVQEWAAIPFNGCFDLAVSLPCEGVDL